MSAPSTQAKYNLSAAIAEIRAEHPDVVIEADDGQVFNVPPPQLWSDEVIDAADDSVKAAKLLLGEQYPAFKTAGGSAAVLMQIIRKAAGTDVGESSAS